MKPHSVMPFVKPSYIVVLLCQRGFLLLNQVLRKTPFIGFDGFHLCKKKKAMIKVPLEVTAEWLNLFFTPILMEGTQNRQWHYEDGQWL